MARGGIPAGTVTSTTLRVFLVAALALVHAHPARAAAEPVTTATTRPAEVDLAPYMPADVLMAYLGRPSPELRAGDHVVMRMLKWVEVARGLNLIPKDYRTISDVAGSLPAIAQHEHLVMLMDVSSRPVGPEGYRLAHMEMAVVVATDGQNDAITDRIRLLLSTYTDKQFGRIQVIERDGTRSYRLMDSRLPIWATWEWGALGRAYVIGVGEGAFQRVYEAWKDPRKSVTHDPWYIHASQKCQRQGAMIEWLVSYQLIRRKLEPVVKGRPESVLEALGAGKLQRGLCTLRLEGRYLICYIMHQVDGQDIFVPLSDPEHQATDQLRFVPPDASCAVMPLNLSDWLVRICNAYLASQSDREQAQWRKWFTEFERRRGVDSRSQLLERLGGHLIVHTWPAHTLKLPLTFTMLLEIDDPVPVRDFIDAFMGEWQDWLRHPPTATSTSTRVAPTTQRTRGQFRWTIGREPDGMWYIQAGVVRPAIAVSDRYIVISWSPEAVRENLKLLSQMEPRPTSAPTSGPR
jgi:hypothetical protein